MINNVIHTGDRNSMHFSVESRVPFVDDLPLVEYVFSIPGRYKIKNKISKHLLREAAKLHLPNEIYQRKDKIGFATPESFWFKNQKDQLLAFLPQKNDELIHWEKIRADWNKLIAHHSDTSDFWRLFNYGVWKTTFLEKKINF